MTTTKPKYKLDETVWAVDQYSGGDNEGILYGKICGIEISRDKTIKYMLSSARHRCHTIREHLLSLTQDEAWEQLQKLKDERIKNKTQLVAGQVKKSGEQLLKTLEALDSEFRESASQLMDNLKKII